MASTRRSSFVELPDFVPHPLLRGPHRQTLFTVLARSESVSAGERHTVPLDDGDAVVLHDNRPPGWQPGDPAALLLHGLTGCHLSLYMIRSARRLMDVGVRVFRLDQRGWGAAAQLARQLAHAGRSEDSAAALQVVSELCPASPVAAIGFSMGGNILLKMLGEMADRPPAALRCAISLSPPIDIHRCVDHLEATWINRLYSRDFARRMRQNVARKGHPNEQCKSRLKAGPRPRSVRAFDELITAPMSGFRDTVEYYSWASANRLLGEIAVPTVVLASEDDPLVPADVFHDATYSDAVDVHITTRGGHVAYFGSRRHHAGGNWMDDCILGVLRRFDLFDTHRLCDTHESR